MTGWKPDPVASLHNIDILVPTAALLILAHSIDNYPARPKADGCIPKLGATLE